jgi:hypothetical protein
LLIAQNKKPPTDPEPENGDRDRSAALPFGVRHWTLGLTALNF